MKRMFILLFVILLLIPTISLADNLSDINEHWAKEYIEFLVNEGIINGFPDGSFKPDEEILRDAFIKMVIKALGYDLEHGKDYWAENYINKAVELNLIDSDEFDSFTEPIKREEMASIMVKAIVKEEFAPSPNLLDYILDDINDYGSVSDEYKQKVLQSYAFGIITGYNGYFRPQGTATRAEASTILTRYLDEKIRQPYILDESVPTVDLPNVLDTTKNITVYPRKDAFEMIGISEALKETIELGEGYGDLIFNPLENLIDVVYYPEREMLELNDIEMSMAKDFAFSIYTLTWREKHSAPYRFPIWDQEDVLEYHLDVFSVIFTELFEDESDYAMERLLKHLNNEYIKDETFTCNGRTVWIFDGQPYDGFGLYISLKNK